jgi:phosphoglycolate phosphatase-like HAD superfamily hydrolase
MFQDSSAEKTTKRIAQNTKHQRQDSAFCIPHSAIEELRVLLWDIDGTLLISKRHAAYKDYFGPSLVKTFGTSGCLDSMTVSGMTDLQIAQTALSDEGITIDEIKLRIKEWTRCFDREMQSVIDSGHTWEVLDGAREILAATKNHPRFYNALLTGNLPSAAQMKLEKVGLWDFFDLPGTFGDESHNRNDLPAFAADRINKALGVELNPSQFIVIGDTPNDIACARHFGARAVAVATGRNTPPELLLAHKPDVLLRSLSDTEEALRALENI